MPSTRKKQTPGQALEKRLPQRYKDLLDGTLKVQDLDDDELLKGKLKNPVTGKMMGQAPQWLPTSLLAEMHKEWIRRVKHKHMPAVDESYVELRKIVKTERLPAQARVTAAMVLLDRLEGKVPETVEVTGEVKAKYEMIEPELIIDLDDEDIVDAEVEE